MHGGGSGGSWNPLWLFCGMKLMFLPIQLCWLEESHGRNTKRLKGCCSLHSLWRQTKRGSQFSWGCFIRFANYEKIAMVTHRGRRKCGKFRQRKMFALRRFFLLAKYGGGNLNDLPWLAAVLQIFLFDCENALRVNALYFACHKFAHVDSATTVIACVPTLAYRGSTCHYKSMQEIDSVIVAIFAFPKGRLWSVFCELGGEQVHPG